MRERSFDAVGDHDETLRRREPRVAGSEYERRTRRLIQDVAARREDARWWGDDRAGHPVVEDSVLRREDDPVTCSQPV